MAQRIKTVTLKAEYLFKNKQEFAKKRKDERVLQAELRAQKNDPVGVLHVAKSKRIRQKGIGTQPEDITKKQIMNSLLGCTKEFRPYPVDDSEPLKLDATGWDFSFRR